MTKIVIDNLMLNFENIKKYASSIMPNGEITDKNRDEVYRILTGNANGKNSLAGLKKTALDSVAGQHDHKIRELNDLVKSAKDAKTADERVIETEFNQLTAEWQNETRQKIAKYDDFVRAENARIMAEAEARRKEAEEARRQELARQQAEAEKLRKHAPLLGHNNPPPEPEPAPVNCDEAPAIKAPVVKFNYEFEGELQKAKMAEWLAKETDFIKILSVLECMSITPQKSLISLLTADGVEKTLPFIQYKKVTK